MDRALSSFIEYQQQAEERWERREEERWKRECEMEEKRRKEDKEHELRLFEKLAEILKPRQTHQLRQAHTNHTYSSITITVNIK